MTLSEKLTGDSSLIRAMSLLQRSHGSGWELTSGGLLFETAYLPDEKCTPVLVHNDVSRAQERSIVLFLCQVVLAEGHSVLP